MGWILSDRIHGDPLRGDQATSPVPRAPLAQPLATWCRRSCSRSASSSIGGFPLLVWGFFVSTVLLWHGTFTINSLTHVFGARRYKTTDNSRNNLAPRAHHLGEGWHNNHHYHQNTANQGWFWWEVDTTFYLLKLLSALGLVWDLRLPSESVKFSFRKYSPEDQVAVESMPAMFGRARLAALTTRARVAEAVKGATELAGPAPLPALRRR